jgi:putative tryptophan/tyrosine transport system substrate-binding protein
MRRRDFTIGMLVAAAAQSVRAQEGTKQHRIAVVIPAGSIASISDTGDRLYQAMFQELSRLGDIEGQNLTVERYSGEGRPKGFPDLTREVAARNPEVIVAITNPVALAVRGVTGTTPIVWIGVKAMGVGLVTSFAHPGGNITGVSLYDAGFYAKRLQILKEAVPTASKVVWLNMRSSWEAYGPVFQRAFDEAGERLDMSVTTVLLRESTPSEYQRVFGEIVQDRPDAILVSDIGDLIPYRQLIVELVEKTRLRRCMATVNSWRRVG